MRSKHFNAGALIYLITAMVTRAHIITFTGNHHGHGSDQMHSGKIIIPVPSEVGLTFNMLKGTTTIYKVVLAWYHKSDF